MSVSQRGVIIIILLDTNEHIFHRSNLLSSLMTRLKFRGHVLIESQSLMLCGGVQYLASSGKQMQGYSAGLKSF